MNRIPRGSRESVAYQLQPKRELQEERDPLKVIRTRPRRRALQMQQVLCIGAVIAISGVLLASQVELTELTNEVSAATALLDEVTNENISLRAQQDRALSLSYVESYAQNELGMVKLDNSAIEYVEMNNPDRIEVMEDKGQLSEVFSGLTRSFGAVLEYLG